MRLVVVLVLIVHTACGAAVFGYDATLDYDATVDPTVTLVDSTPDPTAAAAAAAAAATAAQAESDAAATAAKAASDAAATAATAAAAAAGTAAAADLAAKATAAQATSDAAATEAAAAAAASATAAKAASDAAATAATAAQAAAATAAQAAADAAGTQSAADLAAKATAAKAASDAAATKAADAAAAAAAAAKAAADAAATKAAADAAAAARGSGGQNAAHDPSDNAVLEMAKARMKLAIWDARDGKPKAPVSPPTDPAADAAARPTARTIRNGAAAFFSTLVGIGNAIANAAISASPTTGRAFLSTPISDLIGTFGSQLLGSADSGAVTELANEALGQYTGLVNGFGKIVQSGAETLINDGFVTDPDAVAGLNSIESVGTALEGITPKSSISDLFISSGGGQVSDDNARAVSFALAVLNILSKSLPQYAGAAASAGTSTGINAAQRVLAQN